MPSEQGCSDLSDTNPSRIRTTPSCDLQMLSPVRTPQTGQKKPQTDSTGEYHLDLLASLQRLEKCAYLCASAASMDQVIS